MKHLKNWDNKTWLSSNKYISSFHKFLKSKIDIKKNTHILDIGCGRANIISFLNNKYKFHKKAHPVSNDVMRNGLLLGCHQGLVYGDLLYIENTFKKFAKLKKL